MRIEERKRQRVRLAFVSRVIGRGWREIWMGDTQEFSIKHH